MRDLERIAYEAALRALDKQELIVGEVRARTGLLMATSAFAASLLGKPALFSDAASKVLTLLALVAFAASVVVSLYVLLPKRGLTFALVGSGVYEELYAHRDDPDEIHRRLAYDLARFWAGNDLILTRLIRAFCFAAIALALEVVLLLASVGGIGGILT